MNKQKKIFLGGYINNLNAQNINCRSIGMHLNKTKYQVKALSLEPSDLDSFSRMNLSCIKVYSSFFTITNFFAFLYGIIWCDVAYLPKHHTTPSFIFYIIRLLNKKVFTTIEGNMCDTTKENMIDNFGGKSKLIRYFKNIKNIYGITEFIIQNAKCGVKVNKKPLYLGVETELFKKQKINQLNEVIFVGSLIARKRAYEIIKLGSSFPEITFHVVGDGPLMNDLLEKKSDNIIFYGKLTHNKISTILSKIDLLFLPSRSEGFPKVILEMASAGIPSLVYRDYGASEWLENDKNGFVVSSYEEVLMKCRELIDNPELLQKNSEESFKLAKKFDWKFVIKDWERVIDHLV